jgi:hypothetical protein
MNTGDFETTCRRAAGSALLATQRGELLFELLEAPDQRVALDGEGRQLALAAGVTLILLSDSVLELGLPLVELFELGLEPGEALLGRQVADEQNVKDQHQKRDAREHEEPGDSRIRPVDHGLGF